MTASVPSFFQRYLESLKKEGGKGECSAAEAKNKTRISPPRALFNRAPSSWPTGSSSTWQTREEAVVEGASRCSRTPTRGDSGDPRNK